MMRSPACWQSWGVTLDKNMILDLNPVGQLAGLGPQVVLVTSYASQPIVSDMRGSAVGIPLSRSLDIKDTGKTSVQKLFDSSGSSLATSNLSSAEVSVADPQEPQGTVHHCGGGHVQHRQAQLGGPLRGDRQLLLGGQPLPWLQRQW